MGIKTSGINITANTLKVTPESGDIEFDGTNFYFVINGIRNTINKGLARMHAMDNNVSYCGTAPANSLTSSEVWNITKITINSDGSNTIETANDVAWDNYLTATYI